MAIDPNQNQSTPNRPKAGDGTVHEERKETQANWYGASQQPQEEFIDDNRQPSRNDSIDNGNDAQPVRKFEQNTKNLGGDAVPQAPEEIFPFGDPGAQSDG